MPKKPKPHPIMADDFDWDAAISGAAVRAVTSGTRIKPLRSQKPRKDPKPARDVHYRYNVLPSDDLINVVPSTRVVDKLDPSNVGLGDKALPDHLWTQNDLVFLGLYLKGGITIDSAMKSAGYAGLSQQARYNKAKNIVKAYARSVGDKADIFRDVGLSEVEVAANIKKMIETGRSEQVRLNALALAAKCLRLTDEPQSTHQGVRINIYTGAPPATPGQAPPERPSVTVNTQVISTNKPLQITK